VAYAKQQSIHFRRKLSESGKNKTKFKFNKAENDFQTTASSVYSTDKINALTYKANHKLTNCLVTEGRKG
jgi:hypothetical protein